MFRTVIWSLAGAAEKARLAVQSVNRKAATQDFLLHNLMLCPGAPAIAVRLNRGSVKATNIPLAFPGLRYYNICCNSINDGIGSRTGKRVSLLSKRLRIDAANVKVEYDGSEDANKVVTPAPSPVQSHDTEKSDDEWYAESIQQMYTAFVDANTRFDKSLTALSSGALGFTVLAAALLQKQQRQPLFGMLLASWCMLTASLGAALLSLLVMEWSHSKARKLLIVAQREGKPPSTAHAEILNLNKPYERWSVITRYGSLFLLGLGVLAFLEYAYQSCSY